MRVSIPGVPGVYYDTDAKSTAVTAVLTAAGRKAPKPKGYAVQLLPHLWSFDVDLREVPPDHPIQYLHPEGAHSIDELTREQAFGANVGPQLEFALQFAWAINQEAEGALERVLGYRDRADENAIVIDIEDGSIDVERGETEETGESVVSTDDEGFEPLDDVTFDEEFDDADGPGESALGDTDEE